MAKRRYQNRSRYNRKALGVQIDGLPMTLPADAIPLTGRTGATISIKDISDALPS